MFIKKLSIVSLAVLLAATGLAFGEEEDVWKETRLDEFSGPRNQVAVSVGMRTDETRSTDAQPEVSLKYLRWFSNYIALTADLGFTNETAFSYNSTARTFAVGAGLRLQEPGDLLSAYLEPELAAHRHSGEMDGTDFSRTRLGLSISLGLSLKAFGSSYLDFSLRQVLNAPESRPVYVASPPVPKPPDNLWGPLGGADPYDLYNTTHVIVSYRFSL